MSKSFQLDIVTPTKSFTFDDLVYVECPGTEGYFGVLKTHTNSIIDFKSPKIDVEEKTTSEKESDLIDTFICHLIFYVVFCYSLFLYIFIDLGFGSFLKDKVNTLFKLQKQFEAPTFISVHSN